MPTRDKQRRTDAKDGSICFAVNWIEWGRFDDDEEEEEKKVELGKDGVGIGSFSIRFTEEIDAAKTHGQLIKLPCRSNVWIIISCELILERTPYNCVRNFEIFLLSTTA